MAKVIEIHYSGPSVIIDKTEDDVFLMGRNNKIIIFSIYNVVKGVLFNYVSNRFKITKVVGVDIEGNLIKNLPVIHNQKHGWMNDYDFNNLIIFKNS